MPLSYPGLPSAALSAVDSPVPAILDGRLRPEDLRDYDVVDLQTGQAVDCMYADPAQGIVMDYARAPTTGSPGIFLQDFLRNPYPIPRLCRCQIVPRSQSPRRRSE